MLQIRLLGQFDVRLDGKRIVISSRAGQSLLAYLAMTAGTPHRREKLAGTLWPESSEENARKNLRQELWRIRKAIPNQSLSAESDYLLSDEFTITFNRDANFWLDVAILERPDLDPQSLTSSLSLYQGELLPGFYDDWVVFERERIQSLFESKMERLVGMLVDAERWTGVQEQGERWLAFGNAPEPAYRALMLSHSARGDMAKVSSVYQRCVDDLRDRFGVEPSAETHALYNGLLKGARAPKRIVPPHPSGTVTFLFTDIQGSTRLLDKLGEQYVASLAEHHQILRNAIQKWHGSEMDTQGDAFFVTFTRALDAVQCAAEAQRELASHSWPMDEPIRVRMGLHTGEPLIASTGYVGMDVHRAARIGDAGHGGQILLSQTTRDLVIQDLPQSMMIRDLGEHRLKDMKYPTPIYQLVIEGLQTNFPPLKTKFMGTEAPTPGEPPFKGLQYFEETDADLFFGRELLTAKLIKRIRESQFLSVIIGASGSGKSSLVRAGLVPALKQGKVLTGDAKPPEGSSDWQIRIITPTKHPLQALASELTRDSESMTATVALLDDLTNEPRSLSLFLQRKNTTAHTLLVVDQFEELFTLCRDEFEREAFIDNLLTAIAPDANRITLVITLRADFYAHLAQYPELRDAVAKQQEYIGPMTNEELRSAIEEPAKRGHWEFEPGLVDLILRDVGDEPGALPLLSHALLETWKRRAGHTLTLKGYADAGGVHGAIAHTAESVYQTLSSEEHAIARNIFLRLTQLGEGTEDTRRRASFAELMSSAENADEVRAVLNILADARLVTLGEETAEVAHEALIREWPTLREWLNQDREGLHLHRHLTEAAHDWELLGRDAGALYRGAHLAQAREWAILHPKALNTGERSFLDASIGQEQHEADEREAQNQRELENARKLAEAERQRAEIASQRAAELAVINSVQEGLASKLEMQAIYDLVGDKIRDIFDAQTVLIVTFNQETKMVHTPYNIEKGKRFYLEPLPFPDLVKYIIRTRQPILIKENWDESLKLLGIQATSLPGETSKSGVFVPLVVANEVTGLISLQNVDHNNAFDEADIRLLSTIASSMSVALENARLFDETERLLKETKERAEEQAHLANRLRIRNRIITTVGSIAVILAFLAGMLGLQSNRNAVTAQNNAATAQVAKDHALSAQATAVAERLRAENEKQLATSRELAIAAMSNLEVDQERSILLALQALLSAHTAEAESALHSAVQASRLQLTLDHGAGVWGISYSPDGTRLATTSADTTIKIWDTSTGKEVLSFAPVEAGPIGYIRFSPDGTRLASIHEDHTARIWDATTGEELVRLFGYPFTNIAWNQDGTRLATSDEDGLAKVWDAETGKELLTFSGHTDVLLQVSFSPDGTRLVTSSGDSTAKVWDLANGEELFTLTGPFQVRALWSPDGTHIVTDSGGNYPLKVWDATTGHELLSLYSAKNTNLGEIAFSPDGTRLVKAVHDGTVIVWDPTTGEELLTFPAHLNFITDIAFHPDGIHLATAGGSDGTAKVWDISPQGSREWLTLTTFTGSSLSGDKAVYSPDGTRLAAPGPDNTVMIWDSVTGEPLFTLAGHTDTVWDLAFSPNGSRLATSSRDLTARVWDAASGKELLRLSQKGHGDGEFGAGFRGIMAVAFSPDGKRLATAGADGTAIIWDATTGRALLTLSNYGLSNQLVAIPSLAFSPDGTRLVTTSDSDASDNAISKIWDITTGTELFSVTLPHRAWAATFSPDGKRLVIGGHYGIAKVFDAATGEELLNLSGHTDTILAVAFSPDGSTVATASSDQTAKLWDAITGRELLTLTGHLSGVGGVAFSPDGTRLVTASSDGTARVYLLQLEELIALAKSRVTRSLTTDECKKYLHMEQCPVER